MSEYGIQVGDTVSVEFDVEGITAGGNIVTDAGWFSAGRVTFVARPEKTVPVELTVAEIQRIMADIRYVNGGMGGFPLVQKLIEALGDA